MVPNCSESRSRGVRGHERLQYWQIAGSILLSSAQYRYVVALNERISVTARVVGGFNGRAVGRRRGAAQGQMHFLIIQCRGMGNSHFTLAMLGTKGHLKGVDAPTNLANGRPF